MTRARARADDPWTSWAAARSITDLRPRLAAILHCFDAWGPMTDERLVYRYTTLVGRPGGYPSQTPASIRSRRCELQRLGHVVETGEVGRTQTGGKSLVHALAPPRVPPGEQAPLFE